MKKEVKTILWSRPLGQNNYNDHTKQTICIHFYYKVKNIKVKEKTLATHAICTGHLASYI